MLNPTQTGDPGQGGLIGFRPPQTEQLRPTVIGAIQNAFVAIGWGLVVLACLIAICIVVGPASLWLAGYGVIAFLTIKAIQAAQDTIKILPDESDESIDAKVRWSRTLEAWAALAALAVSIGWWFARDPIVGTWPNLSILGLRFPLSGYGMAIITATFALIWIVAGFMFYHHLVEAVNSAAWGPMQAKPADTPWYIPTALPQAETEPGMTQEEILTMLTELLQDRKPVVNRKTYVMANRIKANGNGGLHKSPTPGSDERTEQASAECFEEDEENGRRTVHVMVNGKKAGPDVPLDALRHYIRESQNGHSGLDYWRERGLSEDKHKVVRKVLELMDLIEPANGQYRESITWLVDKQTALGEFERVFNPPTPPVTA